MLLRASHALQYLISYPCTQSPNILQLPASSLVVSVVNIPPYHHHHHHDALSSRTARLHSCPTLSSSLAPPCDAISSAQFSHTPITTTTPRHATQPCSSHLCPTHGSTGHGNLCTHHATMRCP
eukprot:IDg9583t1